MRYAFFTCLVVALVLVACSADRSPIRPEPPATVMSDGGTPGDAPSGADIQVSGTRLKRRVFKGSDGSQQLAGWFDSERNENCTFVTAADGKLRCLPVSISLAATTFQDPACTKPLLLLTKGCPAPAAASQAVTGGYCATSGMRVLPVGAAFDGANAYQQAGGSCGPFATSSLTASFDIYTTGAEIPASSFVEATEERL